MWDTDSYLWCLQWQSNNDTLDNVTHEQAFCKLVGQFRGSLHGRDSKEQLTEMHYMQKGQWTPTGWYSAEEAC